MRVRSKGALNDISVIYKVYNTGCTVAPSSTPHVAGKVGQYTEVWDVQVPNFKRRSAAGEVFCNTFWKQDTKISNSINGIWYYLGSITCPGGVRYNESERIGPQLTYLLSLDPQWGAIAPIWLVSQDVRDSEVGKAATKAWAGIGQGDEDLLVFLAEFKQTWTMFRHPLDNLHRFFTKIRGKKNATSKGRALTLGQYLSNEWLTYRFGIRPLLSDISNSLKALGHRPRTVRKTSRGNSVTESQQTTAVTYPHGSVTTNFNHNIKHTLTTRAGVLWEANMTTLDFLGVNFASMPAAAWELIPYSFVVDWFANVGDYVRAWTPHPMTRVLASWTTTIDEISVARVVTSSFPNDGQTVLLRPMQGSENLDYVSVYRDPVLPLPSLQSKLNLDLIAKAIKDHRAVDSAALILQRLRSK